MSRFEGEAIDRIKSEVSLVRLLVSQGYKLVKQGKDFVLCCPFHFKLGYANRTLGLRLPQKNRKSGAELRSTS